MRPVTLNPVPTDQRGRVWWIVSLLLALAGAGGAWAIWQAFQRTGRTPAEVLDHVDRRLLGHPTLQRLASPALESLRSGLDAPSLSQRIGQPFHIPPPPPRKLAADLPALLPPPAGAQVWTVGPRGRFLRIADAAAQARDGDVVEIEAGDYRGDVAVWPQRRLTIRGVNGSARLFADGQSAEGKAIWVLRQGEFDISNIDFIGAKVPDGNGAGIRLESGRLRLRHCLFWGNQMGLVTAGRPHAEGTTLDIEGSEFAYSHVQGRWGHNLYVGTIDRLSVRGSYFHHASRGHLLKSRAQVSDIRYSRFTDEVGGRASYELNFPNGGDVRLVGNVVQQQHETENGLLISMGEEGYTWPRNTLTMAHNTLVNDHPHGGAFVRVSPGAGPVVSANNLLVGLGRYLVDGPVDVINDQAATWEDLQRPSRQDYRIARGSQRLRATAASSPDLRPDAQYLHPRSMLRLSEPPRWVGADQQSADR